MHSCKSSGYPRLKTLVAGTMLVAMSSGVGASESSTGDWEYGLLIYGWLPSISGDLNYDIPGSGDGVSVDVDKILDALQMTFMGTFEARKGLWSGFTDVIYLDLAGDDSKSVGLPNGSTIDLFDADMELTGWVWTLGGSYSVWHNGKSHLDLLAGARLLSLDTQVKLTGGGPLQSKLKVSESIDLWDGIVGAKGRIALNDRWFLNYYADVGTGDTDLTWQAVGGVGYEFNWGDVILDYRYMEYDQGSDELLQDLGFSGAMLGVAFKF